MGHTNATPVQDSPSWIARLDTPKRLPLVIRGLTHVLAALATLLALFLIGRRNYLLFHTLTELFSVVVACGIFMVVWNARRLIDNGYLLYMGIAYVFVAALEFLHALTVPGMGVFPFVDCNVSEQLWISARAMAAVSLVIAPAFLTRRVNVRALFAAYTTATVLLALAIFAWHAFPTCYTTAAGMTPFRNIGEHVVCATLIAGVLLLIRRADDFNARVLDLLLWSIVLMVICEWIFTLFVRFNLAAMIGGHYLKLASFYFVYKALIEAGLVKPYGVLFRNLKRSEEALRQTEAALRRSHDELEARVRARTAELETTSAALDTERRRLFSVLDELPGFLHLLDADHRIRFANRQFRRLFGEPGGRRCHEVVCGGAVPCTACKAGEVLRTGRPRQWDWTRPDGKVFQVFDYPFIDSDGTPLVLELGIDITEQRRLEQEVLEISSMEQQRIGHTLHEALGQTLTGVAFLSRVLHRKLAARDLPEAADAARILELVTQSTSQTRNLARGVCPVEEGPEGLMTALEQLAGTLQESSGIACRFQCDPGVPIHHHRLATQLYYIAHEAAHNAARHGHAQTITIELTQSPDSLMLSVEDDGIGLPEHLSGGAGMGLRLMRYRAGTIGAELEIHRRPDGGTVVHCSVPSGLRHKE